jgi:hydroxymethylglutaryl-CoA reductase
MYTLSLKAKKKILIDFFNSVKDKLLTSTISITKNMKKRGGGITSADLIDKSFELNNYYQIEVKFETIDSMGANFINSCLEQIAETLKKLASNADLKIDVIMSILSNYTPMCIVESSVSCSIDEIGIEFANKFIKAVEIANSDVSRAVTHNKGIMNGVDAVVIASGNDFRAVAAGVHAYAVKDGKYKSLSKAEIINDTFKFSIRLPLALGTVGGLTNLHPLVKWCHELLGNPNAKKLMSCIASTGLAQNFAAVKSLITTGIQKGHMKMHLLNILNQLDANEKEKNLTVKFFKDKKISYHDVANFVQNIRLK